MKDIRRDQIEQARSAKTFGIILGTLGRQGSTSILDQITALFKKHGRKFFVIFLSEILPDKLKRFTKVDAWVQIACPRLSIDWGHFYEKPFLSTYEAFAMFKEVEFPSKDQTYPMDFYSDEGGPWTNYWKRNQEKLQKMAAKKAKKTIDIKYE